MHSSTIIHNLRNSEADGYSSSLNDCLLPQQSGCIVNQENKFIMPMVLSAV